MFSLYYGAMYKIGVTEVQAAKPEGCSSETLFYRAPIPNNQLAECTNVTTVCGDRDLTLTAGLPMHKATELLEIAELAIKGFCVSCPNFRSSKPESHGVKTEELVTISDIAKRTNVNREAVRHWANGTRGLGDFPEPRAIVGDRIKIWNWSAVDAWLKKAQQTNQND